jgi:NAD(P)H-dependent FMN reductase
MILVIAATNRPGSNTLRVARLVRTMLVESGRKADLLSLEELPRSLFDASSYAEKPAAFEPIQERVLAADGILVVTPEYNGSFPGVMKYFVDMLRFPESLYEQPVAFIGLAAGRWGALRSVEQLEMIFQYRHAHLYGRRVLIPEINRALDDEGRLVDPDLESRLREATLGFAQFCQALGGDARA